MELRHFCLSYYNIGKEAWNAAMEPYQWFLLGMMFAWTPGLLALAIVLWRRQNSTDNDSRHYGR
jgi:hypothetical protein